MSSAPSALMTPRLRVLRRPKLDVAFHVPSVANLVSSAESPSGGGAETQVYLIARELAGRGLRVGLVCHATDQELPLELDGIQIIRRPQRERVGKVTVEDGGIAEQPAQDVELHAVVLGGIEPDRPLCRLAARPDGELAGTRAGLGLDVQRLAGRLA